MQRTQNTEPVPGAMPNWFAITGFASAMLLLLPPETTMYWSPAAGAAAQAAVVIVVAVLLVIVRDRPALAPVRKRTACVLLGVVNSEAVSGAVAVMTVVVADATVSVTIVAALVTISNVSAAAGIDAPHVSVVIVVAVFAVMRRDWPRLAPDVKRTK